MKIRSNEEIDNYSENDLEQEKLELMQKTNPLEILDYIKNSIEILLNMKDDDYEDLWQEFVKAK